MRTDPMLVARGLWRVFDERGARVEVLRGAGLQVKGGECVGISGPSGSGKTTLLHLLAGIDTANRGETMLDGITLDTLGRRERARLRMEKLGIVFSDHNLSPALTAAENVDLPLAWRGMTEEDRSRRVADSLEAVGLTALARRRPGELSAGERQRVAVARAIAGGPSVIIADEPTSHLDSGAASSLTDCLISRARAAGAALVVASHDASVLAKLDRVLTLRDGVLT